MFAKVCESNIDWLACILLYLRTAPRDGTEQYSACTDRAPQRSQKRRRHKVSMLLHRQTDWHLIQYKDNVATVFYLPVVSCIQYSSIVVSLEASFAGMSPSHTSQHQVCASTKSRRHICGTCGTLLCLMRCCSHLDWPNYKVDYTHTSWSRSVYLYISQLQSLIIRIEP